MSDSVWDVAVQGQQQGPLSQDEVINGIRRGRFGRDAHVFSQGMDNWAPISSRAEFAQALAGAASMAPPPPPPRGAGAHDIEYELFGGEMQYVEITLDPGEA